MKRTTKKQLKAYCERVTEWVERFRLSRWSVVVSRVDLVETLAECSADTASMTAKITIASYMQDSDATEDVMKACAVHEVCHLLLADLMAVAYSRFTTEDELRREEERVVLAMERCLMEVKSWA